MVPAGHFVSCVPPRCGRTVPPPKLLVFSGVLVLGFNVWFGLTYSPAVSMIKIPPARDISDEVEVRPEWATEFGEALNAVR